MKRKITLFVTVLLTIAMLTACGGTAPVEPGGSEESSSSERKLKDEIIFAQGQDIYSLDPNFARTERTYALTTNIFQGLTVHDSDMNVLPCLATSWEWVDELTMKFEIRQGVKFHNGETMTTEDVAWSYNRLRDEPYVANNTSWLKECEAISDTEVLMHLKMPYSLLDGMLCHPGMGPVMPKAYVEDPANDYEKNPVGTGPYKMKEYQIGEYYTLERFEDYWDGPAKTKLLTMKIIPEAAQRTIMLETGAIDLAYEVALNDHKRILENPKLQLIEGNSQKVYMIFFNNESKGAVGNPLVRKALTHAMDAQAIVDTSLYGYGQASKNVVNESVIGYADYSEKLKYDPELAKDLLKEAGYGDGLKVSIWTSSEQNRMELCQIYQGLLQEIGVDLEIEVLDQNTIDSRRTAGEDFDMMLHFYNNQPGHAEMTVYSMLITGLATNWARYSNPVYDETAIQIRGTTDLEKTQELCNACYDIMYTDYPLMPVYNESKVVYGSANLEGFEMNQVGGHKFKNAVVYVD